jgi:alpha-L-rhamnosidase
MSNRKLIVTLMAAALCGMSLVAGAQTVAPAGTRLVITSAGAVGDGTTLNTGALQAAIDKLSSSGGGTLVIPEGAFLSGALFVKSGVSIHLEKNAVLKGSPEIKDFPIGETRIEGKVQQWVPALINAIKVDGFKLTGEGTLDGSGAGYWNAFSTAVRATRGTKNLDVPRPRLVFMRECNDATVSGLRFKDSGFWNLHVYKSKNVLIENLDIRAGERAPSTDGMDIDSSQYVTIKGCYFQVNDDCIALKGTKGVDALDDKDSPPVEHIRISDCTFAQGNGFVTAGSEATVVRDVIVENCKAVGPNTRTVVLLRLKLRTDTPQLYENIHIRNSQVDGVGPLIAVAQWSQYEIIPPGRERPAHTVRNISISNITGTYGSFGSIAGGPRDTFDNITLENIDVKLTTWPLPAQQLQRLSAITNFKVNNVKINGEAFVAPPSTQPTTAPAVR